MNSSRNRICAVVSVIAPMPALAMVAALFVTPAGAAELSVSRTWNALYHCEAGSCKGEDFPAPGVRLVQAPGSNHVQSGPEVEGTLNGHVLTLEGGGGGYHFTETVTISPDGNSWSGPLSDSNGTSGTDTATRVSAGSEEEATKKDEPIKKDEPTKESGPPPANRTHATGMTVLCNYDELTSQDTCTATVADTDVSPTAPSGSATFSSATGGLFAFGRTCTLTSSPSAPSTASCSVQYLPPAGGGFPNISAAYAGDASHTSSAATTRFILPGGAPTGYDTSSPDNGGYPDEVSVEVQTPTRGTEVRAAVSKGETGSAHPLPGKTLRASEDPDIVPEMRTEVEERDREQRYPDIVPEMRKEVEEREIAYEADVARIHREVNEAKRQTGGLNAGAQAEANALVAGDVTVLEQIKQQENSPALKHDPASQPALTKLAKQGDELQKAIVDVTRIYQELTGRVVSALKSSFQSGLASIAKVRPKLVTVGYVRRMSSASTTRLEIPLKRSTLAQLLHGKRSITLNLRVSMVLPSTLLTGGVPISTIQPVKLVRAHGRRHKR